MCCLNESLSPFYFLVVFVLHFQFCWWRNWRFRSSPVLILVCSKLPKFRPLRSVINHLNLLIASYRSDYLLTGGDYCIYNYWSSPKWVPESIHFKFGHSKNSKEKKTRVGENGTNPITVRVSSFDSPPFIFFFPFSMVGVSPNTSTNFFFGLVKSTSSTNPR